jgi:hypothetical protein
MAVTDKAGGRRKHCKRCGAPLIAGVVACACLAVIPPTAAPTAYRHVVVEQQQPTALVSDQPDRPHVPESAYPAHIPGSIMTQAPPVLAPPFVPRTMRAARPPPFLRRQGRAMAGPPPLATDAGVVI